MTTTILVIDDSKDDQRLYQRAFKDFNGSYSLVMASSAEAGFACIAGAKPDLILLDYNLPDMDGLSFMKRLAASSDTLIPIVMLTGESSAAVAVEVMKHGADDYLVKDTEGRYLRLLPGVAGRVMATHTQREYIRQLRQETDALLLRNQTLMQNSMDGIHVMDMQGNIVEANKAFCNMLGYTPKEMAHLNVTDIDAQWPAEEQQGRFKELIGKSARIETVHRCKDGALINVEIACSGIEIEGQNLLFASSRDITERKQKEEELKLNALLLNSTSDSVFLLDFDGNIVYLNETAWKSRGYTRDEMMAMNLREFNTPEFAKLIAPRIKEIREKGQGSYESAHYCKDGSIMPVEINSRVIESDGRKLILASIHDTTERKRAEAVLKLNKTIIDTAYDGFWLFDTNGYLLEVNQAYADMVGYAREELIGMRIFQLSLIQNTPESVRARIDKAIQQGLGHFETQHRHKDGHVVDLEASIAYIPEAKYLFSFIRDITERKKAAAALLMSEANLRAMLDNSPYLSWMKDHEGRYIMINKVFADYLRLEDVRQAIGKTDLDLQPKDLAEKYRADDAGVMAARQQKHVEESAFDGKNTHWVETFKTPIIDVHDNVLGTVGFAMDVTERKHRELETERLLRRNQVLMTSSMDGIHVLDTQGNLVDFNEAFCRMLGYSREEMTGFNVADWSAEFSGEASRVQFNDHLGQSVMMETLCHRKDGVLLNVEISVAREEIDGQVLLFCSSRDITERRKAEEELRLENETGRKRADELAQQFGYLLQSSFDEIYLFDVNSMRFILTSEGAENNLGYSDEELNQLTLLDLQPSFTRESFEELIAPLRRGERQALLFETFHRRKDGTTYPVEVRLQLMEAESPMFLAIVQDITERKIAEQNKKKLTRALTLLSECDTLVIHAKNEQQLLEETCQLAVVTGGYMMAWVGIADNDEAKTVRPIAQSGYEDGYLDKITVTWSDTEFGQGPTGTAIRTGAVVITQDCQTTPRMAPWREALTKRGYQSSIALPLVRDDRTFAALTIYSAEPRAFNNEEAALLEELANNFSFGIETLRTRKAHVRAEQESRELTRHLQTVREEEKASFAREIHDELGGTLAALKMDAHWLAGKLAAENKLMPLQECAKSMIGLINTAVIATRRIITDLRPTLLDDLGLMEAFKWQSAQFQKRTGIECRVACTGDEDCEDMLDKVQSINLFRILQESLTNVARHSGATRVEVKLRRDDKEIVLMISDNGRGLPEGHTIASTSYGLRGMRERVAQLGGKIKIDAPPGGGFSVKVILPLPVGNEK